MSQLFISHSSSDNKAATELKEKLEEQGHGSVFLDLDPEVGIQAGVSWERTLYDKLRSCRAVVALCSKSYLASQWCFAEIALARMEGKELFVLQIDPWGKDTEMPSILTEEQFIDLRKKKDEGYQRLWNGFKAKGILPSDHREWPGDEPPYPGLRAFEEEDAAIFFGRDREVHEGVELLRRVRRLGHPKMVMVLGSSGSGKSSLARAGLVPRLRRDEREWRVVGPFRPGANPARELAAALRAAFAESGEERSLDEIRQLLDPTAESTSDAAPTAGEPAPEDRRARQRLIQALAAFEKELEADDARLATTVRQLQALIGAAPPYPEAAAAEPLAAGEGDPLGALASRLRLLGGAAGASVVLVIDQFEELLGHDDQGASHPANRFLDLLREAMESDDDPPLVLGTMRSDFLGLLQRSHHLQGVGFKSLSVGPMSPEGMRQVIEEPVKLVDPQKLEAGLADRLLEDTGSADALPLLAFTLRLMWERSAALAIADYEKLGGLEGGIAVVANETLDRALAAGRKRELGEDDLRRAFLKLARANEEGSGWARQPASWEGFGEDVQAMLAPFVDNRLLVMRPDGTVEVAHEALFRAWNRLRGWLAANSEAFLLLREIQLEAERWARVEEGEKEAYLWRDGRLARALELRDGGILELADRDREFVEAAEQAERARVEAEARRRRRKLQLAWSIAAVIAAACLVAVGMFLYAREQQRRAQDRALVAVAAEQLEKDPTRAALVLLEISRPELVPRAVSLMSEALRRRLALREVMAHPVQALSIAYRRQAGDLIATSSIDRTARLWTETGEPVRGDGGEPVVFRHREAVATVAFSPDGTRLVTASEDGTARLWAATGGPALAVLEHPAKVNGAVFSPPPGERVATACDDGKVRLWHADGSPVLTQAREQLALDHGDEDVMSAVWSPAGDRMVTATRDDRAWVWGWDEGRGAVLLAHLEAHTGDLESAVFSADGKYVVTASVDGTARVWSLELPGPGDGGEPVPVVLTDAVELKHDEGVKVYRALFRGAANEQVVTAATDGFVRLWSLESERYRPEIFGRAAVPMWIDLDPSREPGRERFASALVDGRARVWKLGEPGEPRVVARGRLQTARFTAAGVLTTSRDGVVRLEEVDLAGRPLALPGGAWDGAGPPTPAGVPFQVTGHRKSILGVVVAPGGDRIVSVSRDGTAFLWDGDGNRLPGVLEHAGKGVAPRRVPPAAILTAAWSPAGDRLVTASADGTARVWTADGAKVLEPGHTARQVGVEHGGPVWSAAWSPAGDRIVTASDDGTARIWMADGSPVTGRGTSGERTGAWVRAIVLLHQQKVRGAAWSPGGDRVVTTSEDYKARVWSSDGSGRPVLLEGHDGSVETAAFSRDGSRIVTGSRDRSARVWNADGSGEPLVLADHPHWVVSAVFGPEGKRVLTTSRSADARLWVVSYDLLAAAIRAETEVCLDPGFRQQTLGESAELARKRYLRCGDCRNRFRDRLTSAGPEEAVHLYRGCI